MSSKRKNTSNKKGNSKKYKKKHESDDSDLSNCEDDGLNNQEEVLIPNDNFEDQEKLPEELLKTMIKPVGVLLISGLVNWEYTPDRKPDLKKKPRKVSHLWEFHRFNDMRVRLVASGCIATHSILVNEEGKTLSFGKNLNGQLGLGDTQTRFEPEEITALAEHNIIAAACGRNHTLFLTDTGTVYACGDNKMGQCGVGQTTAQILKPQRINYRGAPIVKIGCGAEFSVILDCKGGLHTFGCPEYGQLGHNTDGKFFITSNKLSFHYELSPKRVVLYIDKGRDGRVTPVTIEGIVDFSCGQNHTVAIDTKKRAFSWGFGGFGRLGHSEQKDEMVPRLIKGFDMAGKGVKLVSCGRTLSLAVNELGTLYLFGQVKRTGDANMYPKPVNDLAGWNIQHMACGYSSIMISADDSMIAWGASPTFGELGTGHLQKSCASPKEVNTMKGIRTIALAMGSSHTMAIADDSTPELAEQIQELQLFDDK